MTVDHLPLLRNILTETYETIEMVYGVDKEKIRAYVHYLPQFYHFHGKQFFIFPKNIKMIEIQY